MTIKTMRFQIVQITTFSKNFANDLKMTDMTFNLTKLFFSTASFLQINVDLQNAQMFFIIFFSKSIFEKNEIEFQRFKKIEKKILQIQKMIRFKKQKRLN